MLAFLQQKVCYRHTVQSTIEEEHFRSNGLRDMKEHQNEDQLFKDQHEKNICEKWAENV